MNGTTFLTGNQALNAAIISWALAQVIKGIVDFIIKKKIDARRFVGAGGMPSSHSAFVMALATSVGKVSGIDSTVFAMAVCFAIVVMFDAAGVRRSAGEQAKIINYMMQHWKESSPQRFQKELKEILGHTPVEVFMGAALGLFIALIM